MLTGRQRRPPPSDTRVDTAYDYAFWQSFEIS